MTTYEALCHFGGRDALAKALGISRVATYEWGEQVPLLRQYQIEVITGGALRADRQDHAS